MQMRGTGRQPTCSAVEREVVVYKMSFSYREVQYVRGILFSKHEGLTRADDGAAWKDGCPNLEEAKNKGCFGEGDMMAGPFRQRNSQGPH